MVCLNLQLKYVNTVYTAVKPKWCSHSLGLLSSRPWSAKNRATQRLSRCYAAQWPCCCLLCLSMVFSIFVDDVIFWLWRRLERMCWITLSSPGCQNTHSASLPCCNSVFYLTVPAEGEEGYMQLQYGMMSLRILQLKSSSFILFEQLKI